MVTMCQLARFAAHIDSDSEYHVFLSHSNLLPPGVVWDEPVTTEYIEM